MHRPQGAADLSSSQWGKMSFIHVGSTAASITAEAAGNNILIFPHGAKSSHEEKIARGATLLRRAMADLVDACGVTGATRISILMLEEIAAANRKHISASKNLSTKITKLSQFFADEART